MRLNTFRPGLRSGLLRIWRELTLPARGGLALLGAGAVADVWTHWRVAETFESATRWQTAAHQVVLAGMVLTMFGVLAAAAPRSAANRPPPSDPTPITNSRSIFKGGNNAIR